ncbi:hypothetical protein HPB51_008304 [Rhipicephalus microplus]|uniref:Uncharacterized protein n=1 Tax=Rhipicephalus microplus TaxID=6941 RepID=A0A9J6EZT2_RHIMP|nr:hypothetical protein HPB51_008304 [Rhipicephalus microplus]
MRCCPGEGDSGDEANQPPPSYRSRYGQPESSPALSGSGSLSRSKSSHAVKDSSPDAGDYGGSGGGPGASSSWAQYLRNKYGSRGTSGAGSSSGYGPKSVSRSRSSHAVYSRSGSDDNSSEDEDVPARGRGPEAGSSSSRHDGQYGSYGFPRSMYLQKRRMQLKIGTRGTEPGCFTWPRGVAVGPDNSIVVADSSNHRVQFVVWRWLATPGTGEFTYVSVRSAILLKLYAEQQGRYQHESSRHGPEWQSAVSQRALRRRSRGNPEVDNVSF